MAKPRKSKSTAGTGAAKDAAGPRAKPPGVIDATMTLIGGRGWHQVALADIAAASNTSLAELHAAYPSKQAILSAFIRQIDAAMLAGPALEGSPRERLFELIMRRLDALDPYKPGVEALLRGLPCDPVASICIVGDAMNAMGWMLEAAGLESQGVRGMLRRKGLAVIYAATLRVWVGDESEDLAKTMAALDRHLKRAEMLVSSLPGQRRSHA